MDNASNATSTNSISRRTTRTMNVTGASWSSSSQQAMPPLDMNLLLFGSNSSYDKTQEEQITALSADIKLSQEGDTVSRNEGESTLPTRTLQSEQDRKRIERNRRERILSKQRREQRNEENRQMTEQIRRLQYSNDEIKAKIDALFKELSTLLSPEKVEEVKEALSKHNFKATDDISSSLIKDNDELQKRIKTISDDLSPLLPAAEDSSTEEEQDDELEEQSIKSEKVVVDAIKNNKLC